MTVGDLVDGHSDGGEVGYGGKLGRFYINGNRKYARIVFQRRKAHKALHRRIAMCDSFTVEFRGVKYTVTPKKRTLLIEMMTDHQFYSGSDLEDPDHIYSAVDTTELSTMPICDLLVESINDIPTKEVTDNAIKWVVAVAVMKRLYADTDLVESLRKSWEVFSIMRPAWDVVFQKIEDGVLGAEKELTVRSHNEALQKEARIMPDVMQQLQALGDGCPEWAKDEE